MKTAIKFLGIFALLLILKAQDISETPAAGQTQYERRLNLSGKHHRENAHQGDEGSSIEFESHDEVEKTRNYKKVSDDLKVYEEEYSTCIREIADDEYTQDRIDECVGRNFIKVILDIKYVTLKVMAKLDTKVRKMFIKKCYEPAGIIEEFAMGCDFMEKDVIDMMWNGLDFVELVEINKEKYLFEYGKIPNEEFNDIYTELELLAKEFFELLDEIDAHKEIIILRLKTLIDDRTKHILEQASHGDSIVGHTDIHHTIDITETVIRDNGDGDQSHGENENHAPRIRNLEQEAGSKEDRKNENLSKGDKGTEDRNLSLQDKLKRNKEFKQKMINKMNPNEIQQSKIPFKNVHTPQYEKKLNLN